MLHRVLPGEERQADQSPDRVAPAVPEAMRVVRFHSRRETTVIPWKLETNTHATESIVAASAHARA